MDELRTQFHGLKHIKQTNDAVTNVAEETTSQQPALSPWSPEKEEVTKYQYLLTFFSYKYFTCSL
jgi:hypothetical protein